MYHTVSLYSLRLRSVRCCYIFSDKPTAFTLPPLPFHPLTPLAKSTVIPWLTSSVEQQPLDTSNNPDQWTEASQTSLQLSILIYTEMISSITFEMEVATDNDLIRIMHSDRFDINLFKSTSKHGHDCKGMEQRNEEKVMIENGFRSSTLQKYGGYSTELAVCCRQDAINVLQEQVSLASPGSVFKFRCAHDSSVRRDWRSQAMTCSYFYSVHNAVQQKIMKKSKKDVYMIDAQDVTQSCFVNVLQSFRKTAISFKNTTFIAHLMHSTPLPCFAVYRRWIIEQVSL